MRVYFLCVLFYFGQLIYAEPPGNAPTPTAGAADVAPEIEAGALATVDDLRGAKELFLEGIKAFQSKNFEDSALLFDKALAKEPYNKSVLYNLAIVRAKQKNYSAAVGLLRRALYVSPDFAAAKKALEFAASKLPTPLPNVDLGTMDYLRTQVVRGVNSNFLLLVHVILFVTSFALLFRYFGRRKHALNEDDSLPPIPYLGLVLSLIFVLLSFAAVLRYIDSREVRATIVEKTVNLYSGPGADNSALFEIFEGYEVVIKNEVQNWAQVSIPGGITGWVPKKSLFLTTKGLP